MTGERLGGRNQVTEPYRAGDTIRERGTSNREGASRWHSGVDGADGKSEKRCCISDAWVKAATKKHAPSKDRRSNLTKRLRVRKAEREWQIPQETGEWSYDESGWGEEEKGAGEGEGQAQVQVPQEEHANRLAPPTLALHQRL